MLWLLEFTRDGHRYRAELRSGLDASAEATGTPPQGFWFVSRDGDLPRPAFEADMRDEDTEDFRTRIVAAAGGESLEPTQEGDVSPEDEAEDEPGATEHPRR